MHAIPLTYQQETPEKTSSSAVKETRRNSPKKKLTTQKEKSITTPMGQRAGAEEPQKTRGNQTHMGLVSLNSCLRHVFTRGTCERPSCRARV